MSDTSLLNDLKICSLSLSFFQRAIERRSNPISGTRKSSHQFKPPFPNSDHLASFFNFSQIISFRSKFSFFFFFARRILIMKVNLKGKNEIVEGRSDTNSQQFSDPCHRDQSGQEIPASHHHQNSTNPHGPTRIKVDDRRTSLFCSQGNRGNKRLRARESSCQNDLQNYRTKDYRWEMAGQQEVVTLPLVRSDVTCFTVKFRFSKTQGIREFYFLKKEFFLKSSEK